MLEEEDCAALTVYCETWGTYVEALRDMRKNGLTVQNTRTLQVAATPGTQVVLDPRERP